MKSSNKQGDSFVELSTKDGRMLKLIVSDPAEGDRISNKIRDLAFFDIHCCGKTTFKLAFTYAYYKAITGHSDGASVTFDNYENDKDRILAYNNKSWQLYTDPI